MDFIYSAIGKFLSLLDGLTHSYVLALLIFAIIVEVLLLPFGIRQQKNSIKQAKLRPKEMAIRKKYAGRNDQPTQQKMLQEIQDLYASEGYSPMGGCLPLLIQFPILIILYNSVVNPLRHMMGMSADHIEKLVEYVNLNADKTFDTRNTIGLIDYIQNKGVQAFSGLKDYVSETVTQGEGATVFKRLVETFGENCENVPNFFLGSINLAETPSLHQFGWLWLIPVLTFAVYYASTKLTRKFSYQPTTASDPQVGCSNNIMDITMPLMSVAFTFMFPALLGVYWIFKSILSTLKQFILSRVMPLPTFTEEDL